MLPAALFSLGPTALVSGRDDCRNSVSSVFYMGQNSWELRHNSGVSGYPPFLRRLRGEDIQDSGVIWVASALLGGPASFPPLTPTPPPRDRKATSFPIGGIQLHQPLILATPPAASTQVRAECHAEDPKIQVSLVKLWVRLNPLLLLYVPSGGRGVTGACTP